MSNPSFAAALTCIDGRVHEAIIAWTRAHTGARWVDLITEPGSDSVAARGDQADLDRLRRPLEISVRAHASTVLVVSGHAECAANPVDDDQHRADIAAAVGRLREMGTFEQVVGVLVGADGAVTPVAT